MHADFALTANAGLIIEIDGQSILIDALHDRKVHCFSCVSKSTFSKIKAKFTHRHPDIVLVSHRHPDHCSELQHHLFSQLWPETVFLYPENFPDVQSTVDVGNIRIDAISTLHEGEEFKDTAHKSYLIHIGGLSLLFSGDSSISEYPRLLRLCDGKQPDFALMNFPWITLVSAYNVLLTQIRPKHIIAIHLPFEADDTEQYRAAAFRAAERDANIHVLSDPMQTLRL